MSEPNKPTVRPELKPKSPRTIARNAAKLAKLDVRPIDDSPIVPTFNTIPTMGESTIPPADPMANWGEDNLYSENNAPNVFPAAEAPTIASEVTDNDPTLEDGPYALGNAPESDQKADAARAEYDAEHVNPPVNPPVKPSDALTGTWTTPVANKPSTIEDIFGCESELIYLSIPDQSRAKERFDFLFRIKSALDKVSQGSSIASTGKPELDREIRLCCGPVGGRTYAEPFNGLPVPAEFAVKTATLQRGPAKSTDDSKVGKVRQLKSTRTKKPTAWGIQQIFAFERMGDTSKLRVPGGIVSDDGTMEVTPIDGCNYDDLPSDLHKSRAIWGVWKVYDPSGKNNGTLATVRQVMVDEFKAHLPTDASGVRVISEGQTRQTG